MIKAIFSVERNLSELTTEFTYTIIGHADYGEYGHDIVCAAVSAISTMVSNELIKAIPDEYKEVDFTDGFVRMKMKIFDEKMFSGDFKTLYVVKLFDSLFGNMNSLSEEYPLNITCQFDSNEEFKELIKYD